MNCRQRFCVFVAVVWILPMAPALAQTRTLYIYDSNGNQATGSISPGGTVYFYDGNGNVAFGSIKKGSVFLTGPQGQIVFGTIRDGSVFLTDSQGVTTGTIRDGNIFLANSAGDVTYGHYEVDGNSTPAVSNYAAGYAIGDALGVEVRRLVHRLSIKQEGLYTVSRKEEILGEDETGFALACMKKEPKKCRTVEAPMPVRAYLLMEALRKSISDLHTDALREGVTESDLPSLDRLFGGTSSWDDVRDMYCRYARQGLEPSMKYTNLDGMVQNCGSPK